MERAWSPSLPMPGGACSEKGGATGGAGRLFDFPGLAGEDHGAERVEAFAGADFGNLLCDTVVVGGGGDVADDADGQGEALAVHHGQLLVEEVRGRVGVVDEDVVHGVAVLSDGDGFEEEAVLDEAFVHVFAEEHLLAVAEVDGLVGADAAVGDGVVDAVVEDDAVLEDFDDRCTFVAGCGGHDLDGGGQLDVNAAAEEVAACAEYEFGGDEGIFNCSVGG